MARVQGQGLAHVHKSEAATCHGVSSTEGSEQTLLKVANKLCLTWL